MSMAELEELIDGADLNGPVRESVARREKVASYENRFPSSWNQSLTKRDN
jgi:hypothetical protein